MYYYWEMPDPYGCEIFGMLFTSPIACPCTLTSVSVVLYDAAEDTTDTTGDLQITIYEVVDAWPPYIEVASTVVPNEDFVDGWIGIKQVDVPIVPIVIPPEGEWVVGVTTASAADGDTLLFLSDDGSCGKDRSVCWNPWFDEWQIIGDEWGMDINMHIYSEISRGCILGDADASGSIDIDDVVYMIYFIFSGGPAPVPYPVASGDPNCDCLADIDDVVWLIYAVIPGGGFLGGPPPCTLDEWESICGQPF
jgi:hypothetical protein